jgi:hypothetical protein
MLSAATALPTPTTPPDRNNIQLGLNSPLIDRRPDLPRLPFTNPDKPITITDCNNRAEPRPLARVGLFLDKADSQNLLLNIRQQSINDLRLLDP